MKERAELTAAAILAISGAYWKTCALHAAVKLDIFTVIGRDSLTADAVGAAIDGSSRGVPMLLNALVAMGLLRREGDRYANEEETFQRLSRESPRYLGHMIMHHHDLVDSWNRLAEAVKTGQPQRASASVAERRIRENFLMGMLTLADIMGPGIAAAIDLSGRRRLLDLGGGAGAHAVHFCRRNPDLRATVFDLPTTKPLTEATLRRFGLTDRIDFLGGDFISDDFGGPYDVAWLSQVLHGEGPEACRRMIDKTAKSLVSGGIILIQEFILDDALDGPLHPALFALNMLVGTREGRSYSEGQIREMMNAAGFRDIRRLPLRSPNDSGIMMGSICG
ncbi:MAG: methyltransferase [Pseudomonadota bacterium]|nr:methyltransferase [Pseudomonadota bacterium]